MKSLWIGALVLAMAPAVAMADRGGRHYDRGDRYVGKSSSSFGFSFGFGSGGYHGKDYSYASVRYNSGPYYRGYGGGYGYGRGYDCGPRYYSRSYYTPRYCPPPVVYSAPVYVAPPVYYAPARTYYYNDCGPSYYTPRGGYYYSSRYYR